MACRTSTTRPSQSGKHLLLCFLKQQHLKVLHLDDAGETVELEEKMWQQEMGGFGTCCRAQRPGVLGDVQP